MMTSGSVEVECQTDPQLALGKDSQWNQLLADSRANSIFLRAEWLLASYETYSAGKPFLCVSIVHDGVRVAQSAFVRRGTTAVFVADGSADYQDLVLAAKQPPEIALAAVNAILDAIHVRWPNVRKLYLRHIRALLGTAQLLERLREPWNVVTLRSTPAPRMDMSVATEAIKKKSLRRHFNALQRAGDLACRTHSTADAILPKLSEFFDQHVRRWSNASHQSPFVRPRNRRFVERLVRCFNDSQVLPYPLRYMEILLNGRLAAAHFGSFDAGVFTWYLPSFEPELADFSPGEVLLKSLIEQAMQEGARVFDFTIGDESFKSRFATEKPPVVDFLLTRSSGYATMVRTRLAVMRRIKTGLARLGLENSVRRLLRRQ